MSRKRIAARVLIVLACLPLLAWGQVTTAGADTPVMKTVRRAQRAASKPFGLVTDLAYASPDAAEVQRFHDSGAQWTRERLRWDRAGAISGPFVWSQPRPVVEALSTDGASVLGVLSHPPREWVPGRPAGYVPTPFGPDAVGQWSGFVGSAGRALAPYVDAWEVWDHPNDSGTWKPRPHADDYLALLGTAHDTLATRDPGARIILGAAAGVDRYHSDGITTRVGGLHWIQSLLDRGVSSYVDAVAVHPEGATPEQVAADVRTLADVLRARPDAAGLGIWVTEVGWSLEDLGLSAQLTGWTAHDMQAAYLVRTYATLLATPQVDRVFWRGLTDRGADGDFALLSLDHAPRPAYAAYQTVASVLDGASFLEQVRGPSMNNPRNRGHEPVELRFETDGDTVVVTWYLDGGAATRDVALEALPDGDVHLVSITGTRNRLARIGDRVTVQASESPAIVVISPVEPENQSTARFDLLPDRVELGPDALRGGASRLGAWLRREAQEAVETAPGAGGAPSPAAATQQLLAALAELDAERCEEMLPPAARLLGGTTLSGFFALLEANGLTWDPSVLTVRLISASPTTATVRVQGRVPVSHQRGDEFVAGSLPVDVRLALRNSSDGWIVTALR